MVLCEHEISGQEVIQMHTDRSVATDFPEHYLNLQLMPTGNPPMPPKSSLSHGRPVYLLANTLFTGQPANCMVQPPAHVVYIFPHLS